MKNWNVKPESLCFLCANSKGGCSWSDRFEPVEGWKATKTVIHPNITSGRVDSYFVEDCPLFQADPPKQFTSIHPEAFRPFIIAIITAMVRDYADAYVKLNSDPKPDGAIYKELIMKEIESYASSGFFEDVVDYLGLMVNGQKLLEMIRNDPQGILNRLKSAENNNIERTEA